MTLRNGQWINRPDSMYDHSHEYPNSNVLREGPNKSTLSEPIYNRPWCVLLQLIVIASAILCCLIEAGCFDR